MLGTTPTGSHPPTRREGPSAPASLSTTRRRGLTFWALGLLAGSAALVAQPADRFEHLDSRRGLAHNSIGTLLEDRQGFLWIGTMDGLNRFDGVELETWRHNPNDPRSLSGNMVQALLEDRCGNLWVGTSRGLDFLRRSGWAAHRFNRVSIPLPGPPSQDVSVRTLLQDRNGIVWAGLDIGLLRFEGPESLDIFRHDPDDPYSLPRGEVFDLAEDPEGNLWVLTTTHLELRFRHSTLSRFDPDQGKFEHVPTPDGWDVSGFLIDPDGLLWLNVAGLATYDPKQAKFEHPILDTDHLALADLRRDAEGALWITTGQGFLRYQPTTGELSEGLPSEATEDRLVGFATAFAEGRDGVRWLGTRGGLFFADPQRKPFVHRPRQAGAEGSLSSDRISAVLVDHQGTTWLGTYGAGVNRLATLDGPAVHDRHRPGDPTSLCHNMVWDLLETPKGDLWLGVDDGLCRWDRQTDRYHRVHLSRGGPQSPGAETSGSPPSRQSGSPPSRQSVRRLVADAAGVLWLATEVGLQSLDPRLGVARVHHPDGADARLAHSLYLDPDGLLWIGTQGASLLSFDTHHATWTRHPLHTADGRLLNSEGIFDIRPRDDGSLWLASGDGLSRFVPGHGLLEHFGTAEGLPGSSVFSLLEAGDGRLWLGTNQGLSRFDPRPEATPRFRNYLPSDGIGNLEFNRHAAARSADGRFVFGGMDGLTLFRPEQIRDNPVPPRMVLTEVRVARRDGERIFVPDADASLELGHDEASFSVEFAALNFTNAGRNQYQVQLEGFDEGWVDHGTRRFARYHRLPPGKYRLRVRGSNNDGRWSDTEASLALRVRPAVWQTAWFRGLLLVLAAAGLLALHRFRVGRLLEIERLRLRIADDLHDDLSSELSGIALAMEVLQRRGVDAAQEGRITQVRERSLVMLDRLRDIVWCVDPAHDTQEALVRKLRTTAETLLVDHDYELTTQLEGGAVPLPVRRGVLLVFKEAVHNALRHAQARRLDLQLVQTGDLLTLRVADDGQGLDPNTVRPGSGLASMQRRANAMGGTLRVLRRAQGGTEVRLEVPRQPATARRATRRGPPIATESRELGMVSGGAVGDAWVFDDSTPVRRQGGHER